jgi:hypothetical protein
MLVQLLLNFQPNAGLQKLGALKKAAVKLDSSAPVPRSRASSIEMARTKTKKRKTQRAEELAGLQVIFGHGSARSKQDSEQQAAIHFLQQLGGAGAGKKTAKSTLFELAQRGALRPIFITDKVGALFCTTVMMGDGKILLDAKQDQVMRGGDSSALLKIAAEARAMSTKGSIDRDRIVAIMEDEKEKAEIVDFEFFEGSDDLLKAALEAGEGMDAPPAEKRWDDGQLFTFKQFEEYYGEETQTVWDAAPLADAPPPAEEEPAAPAEGEEGYTPAEGEEGYTPAEGEEVWAAKDTAQVPYEPYSSEEMQAVRQALPAFEFREEILKAVNENQVTIIEGETGSGKTTQVVQYILEDAAAKEEGCYAICTQPRRISARSVAERVADERGEELGSTVGYSVRNDKIPAENLMFVTTGVLLRRFQVDQELNGVTHVIVDEIHERSVESDFLLLILRNLLSRRTDLKVILMSATLNRDLFKTYFPDAASFKIKGRTYPVKTFYLEDALRHTNHFVHPMDDCAMAKKSSRTSMDRDHPDSLKLEDLREARVESEYRTFSPAVRDSLKVLDQDAINYELLVKLLEGNTMKTLADSMPDDVDMSDAPKRPEGVLVFLPGMREIYKLQAQLQMLPEFAIEPARSWVLPLHGSLSSAEQKAVFDPAP